MLRHATFFDSRWGVASPRHSHRRHVKGGPKSNAASFTLPRLELRLVEVLALAKSNLGERCALAQSPASCNLAHACNRRQRAGGQGVASPPESQKRRTKNDRRRLDYFLRTSSTSAFGKYFVGAITLKYRNVLGREESCRRCASECIKACELACKRQTHEARSVACRPVSSFRACSTEQKSLEPTEHQKSPAEVAVNFPA
jgi:hypothetical protein